MVVEWPRRRWWDACETPVASVSPGEHPRGGVAIEPASAASVAQRSAEHPRPSTLEHRCLPWRRTPRPLERSTLGRVPAALGRSGVVGFRPRWPGKDAIPFKPFRGRCSLQSRDLPSPTFRGLSASAPLLSTSADHPPGRGPAVTTHAPPPCLSRPTRSGSRANCACRCASQADRSRTSNRFRTPSTTTSPLLISVSSR